MTDYADELGRLLKEARLARDMDQRALARYLGITYQQLWRYETGRTLPKLSIMRDICEYVGIDFDLCARLWIQAKLEQEDEHDE